MSDPASHHDATGSVKSLLSFFGLAFAWSWALWLLSPMLKADSPLAANSVFIAGGFGPSLAAVAVVARYGGRNALRRWMKRCWQWRVGWRWMALAFFFPVVFMALAAVAHLALGGTLPESPARGHALLAAANFPLVFLIGGPLGEEFGWRGYAQPALQDRWGWRSAGLCLGVVWAVWHLPLFYSPGTVQNHLPMGWYMPSAVASSVVFAWLYNRSRGSVLPVLMLHTAVNAWSLVIPVMVMPDGSNLRPFQFVVGILVVTALALVVRADPAPHRGATAVQP